MKLASLLVLIATVIFSQASGAEWAFPENGPSASGASKDGDTVLFSDYRANTTHSPEEVFLWYAKKMELGENHDLVKMAKAGFQNLDKAGLYSYPHLKLGNTKEKSSFISANLSSDFALIHIFHRPKQNPESAVTISIAKIPKGTAISVIHSDPEGEADKDVATAK
jgi:hypothetical protein